MLRFAVIATVLAFLIGPVGEMVGEAIEVGYQTRESNTRLAVSVVQGGNAEIVSASEYAAQREEVER